MDVIEHLKQLDDSGNSTYFTLECRLGNPPEVLGVSKYGTVSELTINDEKPKQSYFYINYPEVQLGGATRFKAHPYEIKMLVDNEGNIMYIDENHVKD